MKILAILRAKEFSPNSVEKDQAIMQAVVRRLRSKGYVAELVNEEELTTKQDVPPDTTVLSMGRMSRTLRWLSKQDARVINSPKSVIQCQSRKNLSRVMHKFGIAQPPQTGDNGYWLKRDCAARQQGDVVFARNKEELLQKEAEFGRRGITDYTVSAHVEGDVIKFYGVNGTGFFRFYYPTADGDIKFDDEQHNGPAHYYPFDADALHNNVDRLASAIGIDIYGGDAIVKSDGSFCIIDFNDWPSFSRCREEAASAIVALILKCIAPKGYIFDYGGTLDTGGCHWGKFFWHAYEHCCVPVTEQQFRAAYVYAERYVAQHHVILPADTFRETLKKKISLQLAFLSLPASYLSPLASYIYHQVCLHTEHSRKVLSRLPQPKVLVSNFYGNLQTVLHEFKLSGLFLDVIESSVVGLRKPDPRIFSLGVSALGLLPYEVAVVGDSINKDILPARQAGCQTIWYRGEQWTEEEIPDGMADFTILDLNDLTQA